MAKEAIMKIRETEAKAEEIVADARKKAQALLEEAKANGQALCETAERDAAKERQTKIAAAQKRGEKQIAAGNAAVALEIEELKKDAAMKKKIAEKIVLRGLEEKCR